MELYEEKEWTENDSLQTVAFSDLARSYLELEKKYYTENERIQQLEKQLAQTENKRIQQLEKQLAQTEAILQEVLNSRSWRVTAPLRLISKKLRGR